MALNRLWRGLTDCQKLEDILVELQLYKSDHRMKIWMAALKMSFIEVFVFVLNAASASGVDCPTNSDGFEGMCKGPEAVRLVNVVEVVKVVKAVKVMNSVNAVVT